MKFRASVALLVAAVCGHAIAQPITYKNLPKYPPPYGSFVFDITGSMKPDQIREASAAIAAKYGYASPSAARSACWDASKGTELYDRCGMDPVAHRRADSQEIAKFGFKTWWDAVEACRIESRKHQDTARYCTADPFLRLRSKG